MDSRRQGFASFPDVDERRMLAAIRSGLAAAEEAERDTGWWQRLLGWLRVPRQLALFGGALCAAAVLLVLVAPPGSHRDPELGGPDSVRIKGGLALHVFRQRGDHAEEMASGDSFHAGDNLRFAVDLPAAARVSVVGIDAHGALYVAWPLVSSGPGGAPGPLPDTRRPAGRGQQLPGAVTMDESLGDEAFYLVQCPPSEAPTCQVQGSGRPPACPKGCALIGFPFRKVP
jgi:hypothetical protein